MARVETGVYQAAAPSDDDNSKPGKLSLVRKELIYSMGQGVLYPTLKCNGEDGDFCKGKVKLFRKVKVKGVSKEVKVGSCTLPTIVAPDSNYCEMQISQAVQQLLDKGQKVSGIIEHTTKGKATKKVKVTIALLTF